MTTSFDEIQIKHQVILNMLEDVQGKITQEHVEQVKELITDIIKAGESVSNMGHREQLRNLLRYWGTWIYDQTGDYPPSQLRPLIPLKPLILQNNDRRRTMLVISGATLGLVAIVIVAVLLMAKSPILRPSVTPTGMLEIVPPNVLPPTNCPSNFWPTTEPAVFRWQPQTSDSLAVFQVSQSGNQPANVFELQIQLDGLDEHKNAGEAFIDLRYSIPAGSPAPLELEGTPIRMAVYVPGLAAGTAQQSNGVQIFVKSQSDPNGGFRSEYGAWTNLINNTDKWLELSLAPGRTKPQDGEIEEGFDPANIALVGIKIATQKGADVHYSGPIWISDVCWGAQ